MSYIIIYSRILGILGIETDSMSYNYKQTENSWNYPLENVYISKENSPFLLGNLTISTEPFLNSYVKSPEGIWNCEDDPPWYPLVIDDMVINHWTGLSGGGLPTVDDHIIINI